MRIRLVAYLNCCSLAFLTFFASSVYADDACVSSWTERARLNAQISPTLDSHQQFNAERRLYFTLTRKLAEGNFAAIRAQLKAWQKLGITEVWISPFQEQTVGEMRGQENDHLYWQLDPGSIAEFLGGKPELEKLIREARAYGIEICADIVLDHLGYTQEARMTYKDEQGKQYEERIKFTDREYFRQEFIADDLYERADAARKEPEVFGTMAELGEGRWDLTELATNSAHYGLPVFNHHNPKIFDWLFNSFRLLVDIGIRRFRLDAFKHIPLDFNIHFMNEMSRYARERYGDHLSFIIEHVTSSYEVLSIIAREVRRRVDPEANVVFLDFPKAFELTRLANDLNYGLNDVQDFFENAENHSGEFPFRMFMGDMENHDFMQPITHPYNHKLILLLSDFFGYIPTIIYHGSEQTGQRPELRSHIRGVNGDGELGQMARRLNEAMVEFRMSPGFVRTNWFGSHHDFLHAEKNFGHRRLVLIVNRGERPHDPVHIPGKSVNQVIVNEGTSQIEAHAGGYIVISPSGNTMMLLEVENP